MSHKSLLPLAVIAALAASPWLQPTASYAQAPTARDLPALIMLVRHAERASQPKDDPPLSAAGIQRAEDLKAVLSHTKLTAIITTQYLRMRDTAHPTATALGLTPEIFLVRDVYNSEEIDGHVKSVVGALRRHVGASVLVVGHGNMISDIIAALGGPRLPIVCDHVFDHLFVLAPTTGRIQLVNARYGTPSPAPGPDYVRCPLRSSANGSPAICRASSSDSFPSTACSRARMRSLLDHPRAMLSERSKGWRHRDSARGRSGVDREFH